MPNYVVIARFDDEMTDKISSLRKNLHDAQLIEEIIEWPPHITIAAYENVDINKLLAWADKFSQSNPPFEIMLSSLGIFSPTAENPDTSLLFAAPAQSKNLIDFYYGFHEQLDDYCGNLGWLYSTAYGHPVIHSTICLIDCAKINLAVKHFHETFGQTKIIALEVYTYPMRLIKRFELSGGKHANCN